MHKLSKYLFLVFGLLIGPVLAEASEADPQAASPVIDLAKTRELYDLWAQRKSFPDTVILASYNAYGVSTLEGTLSGETKTKLVKFVKDNQQDDGGFRLNPKQGGGSNVTYTYFALETLHLSGEPDAIKKEAAADFIKGLIDATGGVRPAYSDQAQPSLTATYYAMSSLRLLNRLDLLYKEKTAGFVLAHRNTDGGFGMNKVSKSSPQSTYMAVAILSALGHLNGDVAKGSTEYLENSIGLLGLTGPNSRAYSTIEAAAYIASGLSLLDALQEVEISPIERFVMGLYVPVNGGFGPSPGYGTTPPSTYYGILCLNRLGKLHPGAGAPNLAAAVSESSDSKGTP